MKNIQDVLREKELQIESLQREIEALRLAAPILEDKNLERKTISPGAATTYFSQWP